MYKNQHILVGRTDPRMDHQECVAGENMRNLNQHILVGRTDPYMDAISGHVWITRNVCQERICGT